MSKFLAPIHSWLYNKIKIHEGLEQSILNEFSLKGSEYEVMIYERFGALLPDAPMEDLIDVNNIHGWLQDRIHRTESRLAFWMTRLLEEDPQNIEGLKKLFFNEGKRLGMLAIGHGISMPEELYKHLQDVLLEGMPCDRVNQLIQQDENRVVWQTMTCLHSRYYDEAGSSVEEYYACRTAFINGFIKAAGAQWAYMQTPIAGVQKQYLNEISIH